jgi:hypothetical protein
MSRRIKVVMTWHCESDLVNRRVFWDPVLFLRVKAEKRREVL